MTGNIENIPETPNPSTITSGPDDEFELEANELANYLSQLSQPGQLPHGVATKEPAPFVAEEVDFRSNDWLERVIDVQAWLCLDQPLDKNTSSDIATLLFSQLTRNPVSACFTVTDGGVIGLSALGRQHLETRLSRAVTNRESFQEKLDDDQSHRDASEAWRLSWEEDVASGSRPLVAINARVATWRTKEFRDFANEGLLDLNPSYQRDVVWSNTESQMLIESILRGIPLPSVILTQVEGKKAHQIVDGKQRLTAILRFIGHHPEGRQKASSLEGGQTSFEKSFRKFAKKNHLTPQDIAKNFFPFPFKLRRDHKPDDPLLRLAGKYYDEIKDETVKIGDEKVTVKEIFESITSEYVIPVIIYHRTPIEAIHRVFGIYNKQGKKLNAEELRNAVYHHLDLMLLLLVLSGDRPAELVEYLPEDVLEKTNEVGSSLSDLGFGTARFKRTKVLSWASAILLHAPNQPSGIVSTPSTASHIDALLDAIDPNPPQKERHPLSQRANLVTLARDLVTTVIIHQKAADAWHPRFRRKADKATLASKWEELPLVASLVATAVLVAAGRESLLIERMDVVRNFTEENRAPAKTQNKTQWQYIASFATGLLGRLGVENDEADRALQQRYRYSCLTVLRRLVETAK